MPRRVRRPSESWRNFHARSIGAKSRWNDIPCRPPRRRLVPSFDIRHGPQPVIPVTREMQQFKRVMVYRIGSMGDTLAVLPAFHLVRRAFPAAHITLLTNIPVNAKAAPMASILGCGYFFDDTLAYPTSLRDAGKLLALRKLIRAGQYDCIVYLAEPKGGFLTSIRDYVFFRSCGIRRVIGVPFSRRTLRPVRNPGSELFMSETARVLECVRVLGEADVNDEQWWDLRLDAAETGEADAVLRRHGITSPFLAASVGTKVTRT